MTEQDNKLSEAIKRSDYDLISKIVDNFRFDQKLNYNQIYRKAVAVCPAMSLAAWDGIMSECDRLQT